MAAPIIPDETSTQSLTFYEFNQDYTDQSSNLGTGSFAAVRLATDKRTGKQYALKMVDINPAKASKADLYYLKTEIQIHRQIDHPNIIKFHDYIQEGNKLYLVLDYAENGNLYNYIQNTKVLTPNEIFNFFYQTCLAVDYIHQNDILHRDIKPENILIDKDLNIKLCDFGWSARYIYDQRTTFCGTYEYMAPEIVWSQPYDYRIDIWSLGVLLYELVHKEAPYKGRSLPEIADSLTRPTLVFSPSIQPEVKDLIERILKIDPNERISLSEILSHTWVKYHLTKREYRQIQANALKAKTNQDSSLSPRIKQNFYMNQVQLVAKAPQERNAYLQDYSVDVQPRQEQSLDLSPLIQVPSVVEVPKPEPFNNPQANTSTEKTESPQVTLRKETEQDTTLSYATDRNGANKIHNTSSTALPNKAVPTAADKYHLRKPSGDSGTRKLFETNIMSPDFNSKLNSVLNQLNMNASASSRRNAGGHAGGLLTGILSPQSQNFNNVPKHNRINSTFVPGVESFGDISSRKQLGPKENTNMTYDFANFSIDTSKTKYDQENFKPAPRGNINPSNLRLNGANPQMTTLKINFGGKARSENVKSTFQKFFAGELSTQNLNTTVLNSTNDTSGSLSAKNTRLEGKTLNGGYSGLMTNGSNVPKKSAFKSFENMISKGVAGYSTKNKENKEMMRENWAYSLNENIYSQR